MHLIAGLAKVLWFQVYKMKLFIKYSILNTVTILIVTLFFSCESDIKKVQHLSETIFIPTGEADTINLKYTDSGRVKSILQSLKMIDYSTAKNPFVEFPKSVLVTLIDANGKKLKSFIVNGSIGMNKFVLDVSSLASGVYLVIINTENIRLTGQLMKQ